MFLEDCLAGRQGIMELERSGNCRTTKSIMGLLLTFFIAVCRLCSAEAMQAGNIPFFPAYPAYRQAGGR